MVEELKEDRIFFVDVETMIEEIIDMVEGIIVIAEEEVMIVDNDPMIDLIVDLDLVQEEGNIEVGAEVVVEEEKEIIEEIENTIEESMMTADQGLQEEMIDMKKEDIQEKSLLIEMIDDIR